MTRPRMVVVVSAIAASTTAFLLVSRGGLFGTAAGAALFPLVYTLVSHWSSEGLDGVGGLLGRRLRRGGAADESVGPSPQGPSAAGPLPSAASSDGGRAVPSVTVTKSRSPNRRPAMAQWLLVGCALVALAFSVYALASPPAVETVETVIVRERVIEKTITVTTQAEGSGAQTSYAYASNADIPGADASTTTTSIAADEEATSTTTATTDPGQAGEEEPLPSTTEPGGTGQDTGATGQETGVAPTTSQP